MTLSDLEWLNEIFSDTKHKAVSATAELFVFFMLIEIGYCTFVFCAYNPSFYNTFSSVILLLPWMNTFGFTAYQISWFVISSWCDECRRTTSKRNDGNGEVRRNTNESTYDEVRDPQQITYATIESLRNNVESRPTPVVNPEQPVIYSDLASLSNSRDINVWFIKLCRSTSYAVYEPVGERWLL